MSAVFLEIIHACECGRMHTYTLKYLLKNAWEHAQILPVDFSLCNCIEVTPPWHPTIQVGIGVLGRGLLSRLVLSRPCPRPRLPALLEKLGQWSHNPQLLPSLWGTLAGPTVEESSPQCVAGGG